MARAEELFQDAVRLSSEEFYVDAVERFRAVIEADPSGELADDAQYNIGLCYFHMNLFDRAADAFDAVVRDYPDALITEGAGNEVGRTAAKALLGKLTCALARGDRAAAEVELKALAAYPDSCVIEDASGARRTFMQLGEELLLVYDRERVLEI